MQRPFIKILQILLVFAWLAVFADEVTAAVNLEKMQQKFVLQTKRITIPSYPDAFNPSVIRWKGSLLLSFRARDPLTFATNLVGFVWLDDEFNVASDPMMLQVLGSVGGNAMQDPRMIIVGNDLYIVYSNTVTLPNGQENRRVFVADVNYDGMTFSINNPDVFLQFEANVKNKWEKNWVPFIYRESLFLSYSIQPHKIFFPVLGTNICKTIAQSQGDIHWQWGDIFGGTPAQLINGEYLAFFHSSCVMSTVHSSDKPIPHYFIGAYTFQQKPPFALTQISPEPIVGPKFYSGPSYKTWKPLRVVYPCGYVYDDQYIWITYGRQDHEVWVVQLDKQGLLDSLIPVTMQNVEE